MDLSPALQTVALYAALLAFVLIWLSLAIGKLRGTLKISIGDGGNARMIRAMRGQANFVENVPLCLILLTLMALLGAATWLLHALGIALVVGRVLHGLHFMQADAPGWQRGAGAGLTMLALLLAAIWLIVAALGGAF